MLRQLVSVWFQVLLTPLEGVLFIFRSRYFSLSVVNEYLALGDGPPGFRPDFTWPALLGEPHEVRSAFKYGTITLFGSAFHRILLTADFVTSYVSPTTPPNKPTV